MLEIRLPKYLYRRPKYVSQHNPNLCSFYVLTLFCCKWSNTFCMYSCQLRLCLRLLKGSSGSFPPGLNLWTSASVFSSTRVWSKSNAAKILLWTLGGEAITICASESSCFFQKQVQVNVQSSWRFRNFGFLSCRPAETTQSQSSSKAYTRNRRPWFLGFTLQLHQTDLIFFSSKQQIAHKPSNCSSTQWSCEYTLCWSLSHNTKG